MMKKAISLLLVLLLFLSAIPAHAETEHEIRFLEIPWGSSIDQARLLMSAMKMINEDGEGRFDQIGKILKIQRAGRMGSESSYPHFVQDGGIWTVDREGGSPSVAVVPVMSGMIPQTFMGVEVHNIQLVFALDGLNEKLVNVQVNLMVNDTDLRPQLEEKYGAPDQAGEWSAFWKGAEQTGLMYDRTSLNYGLLNAQEIVESSEMEIVTLPPTPAPTAAPDVTGTDILDYIQNGEPVFMGIPWNSDTETAWDILTGQVLISQDLRKYLADTYKPSSGSVLFKGEEHWETRFTSKFDWSYFFISGSYASFQKTFCGQAIDSVTFAFEKKNGETKLKSVQVALQGAKDGKALMASLKDQISERCGEPLDWYGTLYWDSGNGTVIQGIGIDDFCAFTFGVDCPE